MQTIEQRMTLRRFVRVTFDNFRQLLQTISAPVTSLPMPSLVPPAPLGAAPSAEPPLPAGSPPPRAADPADAFGGEQAGDQPLDNGPSGEDENRRGTRSAQIPQIPQIPSFSEETRYLAAADLVPTPITDDAPADTAPVADILGSEVLPPDAPLADAPLADALGSDLPDDIPSPAHPVTRSPAHPLTLPAALESLLFVSDEAVEPLRLAQALGVAPAEVEAALAALDAAYREERRGLRLQVRNGRYQLVSAPEAANLIETYLNLDASARLSAPALETLAVVAYRQPVTRSQIEAVRGVDCSGVLRSLIGRGLLEEVGRLDAPGRPVLYGVTDLFMHHFGLTALHELPPLEDAEIARIEEVGA